MRREPVADAPVADTRSAATGPAGPPGDTGVPAGPPAPGPGVSDVLASLPAAADQALDRFARLATAALGTPVALVSSVRADRQVLPGAVGLPEPWQAARETPLTHSVCRHVQAAGHVLAFPDVRADPLTADSLAAPDLGVVAYAGAPLRALAPGQDPYGPGASDGPVIGVLCAIDTAPREWTATELALLSDLAAACSAELHLRVTGGEARRAAEEARAAERRSRLQLAVSEALADVRSPQEVASAVALVARRDLDAVWAGLLLVDAAGEELRHVVPGSPAGQEPVDAAFRAVPLDGPTALAHAARSCELLLFSTTAQLLERFPASRAASRLDEVGATAHVPLVADGKLLGVVVLAFADEHVFSPAEVEVANGLAQTVAQAVARARLIAEKRTTAEVLQRALLTRMPQPDHLELRARYVTAGGEEVGGDWYDALVGADGATSLVIGDVTGHDIVAAGIMGQIRGTLRAFAHDRDEGPAEVVRRLDRAMPGLQISGMATLVLARVEQTAAERARGVRRLRWTNAGHPAPVLLLPDGSTQLLATPPDLLVGVLTEVARREHEREVPAGSTVVLYTDGLIEHRGRSLRAGLDDLRALLSRRAHLPLEQLLDEVVAELVGTRPDDDCALLAVRMHPQG